MPGAGTIQNEAPAEMQGLCCFWRLELFRSFRIAATKTNNALSISRPYSARALRPVTISHQPNIDGLLHLPIMHPNTPAKPRLTQSASSNRAGFFCLEKTT